MVTKTFIEQENNIAEDFLNCYVNQLWGGVILYGGGWAAHWYVRFLAEHSIVPKYIIDNDPNKKRHFFEEQIHGKLIRIPIISKEDARTINDHEEWTYIVGAPKYKNQIISEITQTFGNVTVYSFEAEIYYTFIKDISAYRNYLTAHYQDLQNVYELLEDEKSKTTFDCVIMGRVTANQDYFIKAMVDDQYFPRDIIKLHENEVIVEVGSNDGKTLLDIIDRTEGKFRHIYCFEPDKKCIVILRQIITDLNKPIDLVEKGCGIKREKVFFKTDAALGGSKVVTEEESYDYSIDITTLDEEIKEDITYLKMDIEGLELDCLRGAEELIKRCKPKLAVCVYHNQQDIVEIPLYLHNLNPEYKFYLRHHNWGATETVLYAI